MSTETSFNRADKLAVVLSFVLLLSYTVEPVRGMLGTAFNAVFGVVADQLPFLVVLVVSALFTAFVSTTIRGVMTDPDALAAANERMAELQQKIGPGVDGKDELSLDEQTAYQKEAMGAQLTMFKMQFRPVGWTLLVSLPVFLWLSWKVFYATGAAAVTGPVVLPLVGETTWGAPLLGPFQTWIVVYILLSAAFSQVFLKTIGWNQPTPQPDRDD